MSDPKTGLNYPKILGGLGKPPYGGQISKPARQLQRVWVNQLQFIGGRPRGGVERIRRLTHKNLLKQVCTVPCTVFNRFELIIYPKNLGGLRKPPYGGQVSKPARQLLDRVLTDAGF